MDKRFTHRTVIGVIGSDSKGNASTIPPVALAIAEEVGALVANKAGVLVTGGRGGIMEAACRGANLAGGIVVGFLPGPSKSEANQYVTIPLATDLGNLRNAIVARSSDAVIMICGGQETLQEAIVAYGRKPLIIVEGTGGWADRMRQTLYDEQHFDERGSGGVIYVSTAEEAVSIAFKLAVTFRPKEGLTIAKNVDDANLPDPS
jgi:uncharacterized protein (TIGR00725 family)